jgi:hypothetical protein
MERDASLGALLGLDGQVYVIDPDSGLWVRFVVRQVPGNGEKATRVGLCPDDAPVGW